MRAAVIWLCLLCQIFLIKGLVLQTEQPHTVQLARELFARCGVQGDVLEKQRPSGVLYGFNIREPEQSARMHELFSTKRVRDEPADRPRLIAVRPASVHTLARHVQQHRPEPAEGVQSGF